MECMKLASFRYSCSGNIGDEIQTLAARTLLPRIGHYLDRDHLNKVAGPEKFVTLMNGWFSHYPEDWPPSEFVLPVFTGFHMTPRAAAVYLKSADYFKRFQPIGCRDDGTRDLMLGAGVDAHTSYCVTLTFERRARPPAVDKTFLVDTDGVRIPRAIRRSAMHLSHKVNDVHRHETKLQMAAELLEAYRTQAARVVTTKLHCALPCIAMGIPVIFFGDPRDYRVSIVQALGLPIYDIAKHSRRNPFSRLGWEVDWKPEPVDVSEIRDALRSEVNEKIARYL